MSGIPIDRRQIWVAILCAAAWTAGGCCPRGNPMAPEPLVLQQPAFGAQDSVFTDEQVLGAAFTNYSNPPGFYSEPPTTYAYPLYVSTFSVAPPGSPRDRWIELSTEDTMQARAWAVASVPWCTVDPGPPTVTRRYFEFATHEPGQGPRMPVRVHRASYLDRSAYDRFHPGSLYGVLMARPIDRAAARDVAEFLWFKEHRDPWTKVLTSFSRPSDGSVLHTIFFVQRIFGYGLFGPSEYARLVRNDFRVDTASGAITFRERHERDVSLPF